jgi:hypothetical protein
MKKKYWEYKKEETKKCWHDLVNWWHEWGIFFGLFGWLIPISKFIRCNHFEQCKGVA